MVNNLHITLTDFKNESRILKITRSLLKAKIVGNVFVAALYSDGTKEDEQYADNFFVKRFILRSRGFAKSVLFQLIKYVEFTKKIFTYYSGKEIAIINIHHVDLLPLGVYLKQRFHAILIYDAHELETEKNGLSKIRRCIFKFIERTFIRHSDLNVVVSNSIADWYSNMYKIQKPLVILNTPPLKEVQKKNNIFREKWPIPNDVSILLYQGGLMQGRGIELLLETFKINQFKKTVIIFMGYGPLEDIIKQTALTNKYVYFHPVVSPDELFKYTISADFGISLIEPICLSYYYSLPNKLFEYIMADIPVIVSNLLEMARLVKGNRIGVIVNSLEPHDIVEAINNIKILDYNELKANIRIIKYQYSWETQEEKLVSTYRQLLQKKELINDSNN